MSEALTKDAILKAADRKIQKVEVPEWGGHVFVRVMSGAERGKFEEAYQGKRVQVANIRQHLAVITICDEAGNSIFDMKDLDALGDKSAAALDRIFSIAMDLNRIGDQDIEELEKN